MIVLKNHKRFKLIKISAGLGGYSWILTTTTKVGEHIPQIIHDIKIFNKFQDIVCEDPNPPCAFAVNDDFFLIEK